LRISINEVWVLAWTDQLEQARTVALEGLPTQRSPADSAYLLGQLGCLAARQGRREEALRYSTQLAELSRRPYMYGLPAYHRAKIAARLGEREVAVRLLQEARMAGHSNALHWWMHRDPDLASLRGYPPFEQLLKPKG
jgi:GNAT superfamily N-acetyltransferase